MKLFLMLFTWEHPLKIFKIVLIFCATSLFSMRAISADIYLETNTGQKVLLYKASRALVIGMEKYGNGWNRLSGVPRDVASVSAELRLQGFEVIEAPNLAARDILPRVMNFLTAAPAPESRAIVYFSGHGWTDTEGNGYLVGVDSSKSDGRDPPYESMVPVTFLRDLYKQSKYRHTLLVLDSCYSGAVLQTKSLDLPRAIEVETILKKSFQILASGQADQRVSEDDFFSSAFVAGIQGGAAKDSSRRFVSFNQLAAWIKVQVPGRTNQTPVAGDFPYQAGDMIFSVPKGTPVVGVVESATPRTTVDAGYKPATAVTTTVTKVARAEAERSAEQQPETELQRWFSKTPIFYYRKPKDELAVINGLNRLGYKYVARPPELSKTYITNAIGCGPTTPAEAIRAVATELLRQRLPISVIVPYRLADKKGGRIEISSYGLPDGSYQNLTPFTQQQIDSITSCEPLDSEG